MEILKLTSIRLSKKSLAQANELGKSNGYYKSSDVIRIAIWIGMKFLKPGILRKFLLMMFEEENKGVYYTIDDVLRAAAKEL